MPETTAANTTTVPGLLGMADALEPLASSDVALVEFFEQLTQALVQALDGTAGAAWMIDQNHAMGLLADCGLTASGLLKQVEAVRLNQRLLTETVHHQKPRVVSLATMPLETESVSLIPVMRHDKTLGVIEVFGPAGPFDFESPADRQALAGINLLVTTYLDRLEESARVKEPGRMLETFQSFTRRIHESLDPEQVTLTAVNELRAWLQCDRVTLLERFGSRYRVTAVSGQRRISHRSNQVRLLTQLTNQTMRRGDRFVFPTDAQTLPPTVGRMLAQYVEESSARLLITEPLIIAKAETDPAESAGRKRQDRPVGAIVIEQFGDSRPHPGLVDRLPGLAEQVALAVRNAQRHERLLLIPGLRTLGHTLGLFRGRRLAAALAVVLLLAGLVTAAFVVPGELTVEGQGHLMPVVQRGIYAPLDGEVAEVFVQAGQQTQAGEPLLRLANPQLQSDLLLAMSQLQEKQQAAAGLKLRLHESADTQSRAQLLQVQAEIEQASIDIKTLQRRIELLELQSAQLTIVAPIAGSITTFQPEQLLLGRPVRRGEMLLEVMDDAGPWQLELSIPEHRTQPVLDALNQHASPPVNFKLASQPDQSYPGRLTSAQPRTTVTADAGAMMQFVASLEPADLPDRRIGADVIARVECGQRSLAYVYFGELWDFLCRRWWF